VHQSARISHPWNVTLCDRSCVGERANLYSLGKVHLGAGCTVAQEGYICTGTHNFSLATTPLVTAEISIGADAFVGLRAIVLPGVAIGAGAIVGAGSVVTRDIDCLQVVAGCPARAISDSPIADWASWSVTRR